MKLKHFCLESASRTEKIVRYQKVSNVVGFALFHWIICLSDSVNH